MVVAPSKTGNGVFTKIKIPAGSPVIEVTGDLFNSKTADHNHPALLQVGPDLYIGPSGDVDDYVNHSCNPNCLLHCVGSRAILFALHDIPAGSEITFDYSTSSTENKEQWQMKCLCGYKNCRKIISGFQYLDSKLIDEYHKKNMIPLFISNSIFKK